MVRMKHTLTSILLYMAACTPTVRIYSPDDSITEVLESGEVGEVLDVNIELVDEPGRGVVEVEHSYRRWSEGRQKLLCGQTLERFLGAHSVRAALEEGVLHCRPRAWSCASVTFVAHELGHVLGLNHAGQCRPDDMTCAHTGEEGNLMQPSPYDSKHLTRRQKRIVRIHAHGLERICTGDTTSTD